MASLVTKNSLIDLHLREKNSQKVAVVKEVFTSIYLEHKIHHGFQSLDRMTKTELSQNICK